MSAYFHFYLCGRKAAEWLIDMKLLAAVLCLFLLVGCAEKQEEPTTPTDCLLYTSDAADD